MADTNTTNPNPVPEAASATAVQQPAVPVEQPATPTVPTTSPPAAPDAVSQDITKLKGFMDKIKQGIKQKQEMAKAAKDSPTPTGPAKKPSFITIFTKNKLVLVALAIFIVLCVLLIAASVYKSLSNNQPANVLPTATPETLINATPSALIVPSRYATDSGVLELETKINELDKELSATSIKESQLTPPTFDFDIKF